MKLLTWNINGIRSIKRPVKQVLDDLDADIVCLQETKVTRDMLDEPLAIVEGYNAYYSFSRKRTGYSGTAIFCRDSVTPIAAEEGLSGVLTVQQEGSVGCYGNLLDFSQAELQSLDSEGRGIITQHQIELSDGDVRKLSIINVYIPRATERDERWTFKLKYLALLQHRAEALLRQGSHVIVLGDLNTTHKHIDHCDPTCPEFTIPDSRQWMNQFLREEDRDLELAPIEDKSSFDGLTPHAEGGHFMDAFRFFYPDKTEAYTNWTIRTSARQTNYGKRLDYIYVDVGLMDYLVDCQIIADFEGSDHCPVVLDLRCCPVRAKRCPALCTKYMPEFQGKQQKLSSFFTKTKITQGTGKKETSMTIEDSKTVPDDSKLISEGNRTVPEDGTTIQVNADTSESIGEKDHSQPDPGSDQMIHSFEDMHRRKEIKTAEIKEMCQTTHAVKRTNTSSASSNPQKKQKGNIGKNTSSNSPVSKQSSLLTFFKKPGSTSTDTIPFKGDKPVQACRLVDCEKEGHQENSTSFFVWSLSSLSPPDSQPNPSSSQSLPSSLPEMTAVKPSLPVSKTKSDLPNQLDDTLDTTVPSLKTYEDQETLKASTAWKGLLSGPPPPPLCKGHNQPCILRTVKKAGPNKGKQFYVCARPEGHSSNKDARCDYFKWISSPAKKGK